LTSKDDTTNEKRGLFALIFLVDFDLVLNFSRWSFDCDIDIVPLFTITFDFVILRILPINLIDVIFLALFAKHNIFRAFMLTQFFEKLLAPLGAIVKEIPFPILIPQSSSFATHSRAEETIVAKCRLVVGVTLNATILVNVVDKGFVFGAYCVCKTNLIDNGSRVTIPSITTKIRLFGCIDKAIPPFNFLLLLEHLTKFMEDTFNIGAVLDFLYNIFALIATDTNVI
jgi:hypothetical protein